jgi:type I site-specific restriction endonuclease
MPQVRPAQALRGRVDRRSNQRTEDIHDGRIVVVGEKVKRREQKRADYLLRYRRDFSIAVVEAKSIYKKPGDGLQQAKEYAQILGLKFAYATNGHGIVEHDFLTGRDNDLETYPSPDDLWKRLTVSMTLASSISAIPRCSPDLPRVQASSRCFMSIR